MEHEYKQFYRRKLPHVHSPGGTLFITFRLAGSIPKSVMARYRNEKAFIEQQIARELLDPNDARSQRLKEFHRDWFKKFEDALHKEATGPLWLKNDDIARMVSEALEYRNDKEYLLRAYSIMSNHVHVVCKPILSARSLTEIKTDGKTRFVSSDPTLGEIMRSLKGFTARKANKLLGCTGQFWEAESYDREVRNSEEFYRIVKYVLKNPVKARLVRDWREWKWNWLAADLQERF